MENKKEILNILIILDRVSSKTTGCRANLCLTCPCGKVKGNSMCYNYATSKIKNYILFNSLRKEFLEKELNKYPPEEVFEIKLMRLDNE